MSEGRQTGDDTKKREPQAAEAKKACRQPDGRSAVGQQACLSSNETSQETCAHTYIHTYIHSSSSSGRGATRTMSAAACGSGSGSVSCSWVSKKFSSTNGDRSC